MSLQLISLSIFPAMLHTNLTVNAKKKVMKNLSSASDKRVHLLQFVIIRPRKLNSLSQYCVLENRLF